MIPVTVAEPLVAVLAVQPPVAVQLEAFVELHATVDDPPLAMLDGVAVTDTVACGTTVTVAEALPVPPVPVQEIWNVRVAVMPVTVALPLAAVLAVQPPVALQLAALVELHVSVEEPPLAMLAGLALSVTTGVGTTVTVVELLPVPPLPVQLNA